MAGLGKSTQAAGVQMGAMSSGLTRAGASIPEATTAELLATLKDRLMFPGSSLPVFCMIRACSTGVGNQGTAIGF